MNGNCACKATGTCLCCLYVLQPCKRTGDQQIQIVPQRYFTVFYVFTLLDLRELLTLKPSAQVDILLNQTSF